MTSLMILLLSCLLVTLPVYGFIENRLSFSCDFGTFMSETFCGMLQDVDDNFDWKLTSSSEKDDTGSSHDHTGDAGGTGRFLWADSRGKIIGATATIAAPPLNLTDGEGWVTFWFHLYGDGKLDISVCPGGSSVLTLYGDQGNRWHEQNLTVSCGNNPVQLTFTSTVASRMSDVGIDDLYFYDGLLKTTAESLLTKSSSGLAMTSSAATSSSTATSSFEATSSHAVTSSQTRVQSSSPFTETFYSESHKELAISLGILLLLFAVYGVLITFLHIKLRVKLSKIKSEQPEKPYMDLVPTESARNYETMATGSVSKDGESSYENQTIVTQHQHIHPKLSVGDEYEY